MSRRKMAGFTLMELLIVVIILGLLATLALPQFTKAMERARQAEARTMLGQMFQAQRMYYSEHDTYTATAANLVAAIPAATSGDNYFSYTVQSGNAAGFVVRATRKTTAGTTGKSPGWTTQYTIELDQAGSYTGGQI